MNNLDSNEMMEAIESSFTEINRGDIVEGEVIFVTGDEIMVNINYKSDGIITKEELDDNLEINLKENFKEGDIVEVYVMNIDDGEGNVSLSIKKVKAMKDWEELEQKFKDEETININVVKVVKGGLIALFNDISGFIPASHVSARYVTNLEQFVGQDLEVKLLDFNSQKNRIIFSRKEVEQKELEEMKEKFWSNIEIDSILEGTVQRLTNFGAFVDLGGVDGLIHISDLSWNRINHPSEIVNPGEKVEVKVLDFDQDKNRISLGLKQTVKEPWELFKESVDVGDIVDGLIVNILDFGAFVRLEEGVDGLLHVSEISEDHIAKPSDVLKLEDKIKVKIIDIDYDKRRISLSKKEANDTEAEIISDDENINNTDENYGE